MTECLWDLTPMSEMQFQWIHHLLTQKYLHAISADPQLDRKVLVPSIPQRKGSSTCAAQCKSLTGSLLPILMSLVTVIHASWGCRLRTYGTAWTLTWVFSVSRSNVEQLKNLKSNKTLSAFLGHGQLLLWMLDVHHASQEVIVIILLLTTDNQLVSAR